MALRSWTRVNGVVSGTSASYYFGGFEWQVTNSDADRIANNRSVISIRMFGGRKSSSYNAYNLFDNTSYFEHDGGNRQNTTTRFDFRNATANVHYYVGLNTSVFPKGNYREITIIHNSNGTRQLPIKTFFYGLPSGSITSITTESTVTLPTIPRASTITATNAQIESATSININRVSSSFTHTLKYSFGSLSGTIATGVGTSYGWIIPSTFYAQIPNNSSGTCTITCETYNGATLVGTSTTTFTASVNQTTNAPGVMAYIEDTNAVSVALTGNELMFVKFMSNAYFSIDATAKNGASITSRKITCGDGKTSTSSSGTLNSIESGTFTVEATDSRGIKNTVVYNKDMINYVKLTLNANIYRTAPTSSEILATYSGNYFNGNFGAESNTLTVKWRYKENGTATWGNWVNPTPTISGNTFNNGANPVILGDVFDYTKKYDFEMVALDKLHTGETIKFTKLLPEGEPTFAILSDQVRINKSVTANNKGFNIYTNKTAYDSLSWIEMWVETTTEGRTGELAYGAMKHTWRTGNQVGSAGTERLILDNEGNLILRGGYIYGEKELYNNITGTNGNITLSETSSNFNYLEFFFRTNDNIYDSAKIYTPSGKNIALTTTYGNASYSYIKTNLCSISGTGVTRGTSVETRVGHNVATLHYSATNIYIVRIVGYR